MNPTDRDDPWAGIVQRQAAYRVDDRGVAITRAVEGAAIGHTAHLDRARAIIDHVCVAGRSNDVDLAIA